VSSLDLIASGLLVALTAELDEVVALTFDVQHKVSKYSKYLIKERLPPSGFRSQVDLIKIKIL
jgi:hypothetical protein